MSHPPETSRELAERIWANSIDIETDKEGWLKMAAALIDAWVRVREAEARLQTLKHIQKEIPRNGVYFWEYEIRDAESALAKARKQLKGGGDGQAEAPSAAASANSEPGGA